jgi:hypothetical protein
MTKINQMITGNFLNGRELFTGSRKLLDTGSGDGNIIRLAKER